MFLNNFCSISPLGITTPVSPFPEIPPGKPPSEVYCHEPDYTTWMSPIQIRRMSKMIRMGVTAARICSEDLPLPDSIHVGTAYGLLEETEIFLKKMITQNEQMLTPTAFIQSTHNTVAGQIALLLKRNVHNMTFVHKGHSFENAMVDAMLLSAEGNALVGSCDILTDTSRAILTQCGVYNANTTAGEGVAFFHVSGTESDKTIARLSTFRLHYTKDTATIYPWVKTSLQEAGTSFEEDDLFLNGGSDMSDTAALYARVSAELLPAVPVFDFKKICGNYPTAASYGLGCSMQYLATHPAKKCCLLHNAGAFWSLWILEGKAHR